MAAPSTPICAVPGSNAASATGPYDSCGRLAGKRRIEDRPQAVDGRTEFGHWEIDTVLGRGSKDCIITVVERTSLPTVIGKLRARTKKELNTRLIKLIKRHDGCFKTITADNGTEFYGYKDVEKVVGVEFYFATPHHS